MKQKLKASYTLQKRYSYLHGKYIIYNNMKQ